MKKLLLNPPNFGVSKNKLRKANIKVTKSVILTVALILISSYFNFTKSQCNAVTYITYPNNCGFDQIINVTFATINRSSACDANTVYITPTPNVMIGQSYTLSITTGADVEGIRAWIDYNIDGTFTNSAPELVLGPLYAGTNPATYSTVVTIPAGATPGFTRLRARCNYASATPDASSAQTWGETEDYCINIIPAVPCSGIPGANSILGPGQFICPNTSAVLSLANTYTTSGIIYQWQQATLSNVGPFTPIPTATNTSFTTPSLTANTWYNAVITCTGTNGQYTTAVNPILIQGVTTNTAPYIENFDGIVIAGKLPNCSWVVSNTVTCLTYTSSNTLGRMPNSGTNFASFYNSPAGINYFYSNGIYMTAGITYSANVMYETEYYGYNNWTDLSILYGTTQTPTGLVSIVSTNGPAISSIYKALGGTFQVPSTGLYYIAVRGTGASGSAPYLTFDDLSITIPCLAGSPNTPTVTVAANTTTLCQGDAVNLTATGANTYTWDTGSNATGFSDTPSSTYNYAVIGTNTLTGCMDTAMQIVTVYQTPSIFIAASSPSACLGSSVSLHALGGSSYVWSNGSFNANISVSPTSPTTYTVLATGSNGCTGSATYAVALYPPVNVTASSSNSGDMCIGETVVLTAIGTGVSFLWVSNSSPLTLAGNPVTISPNANSVYTVTATDANGCQKSNTVVQNVNACTGIATQTIENGLNIYPNPTSGEFSIESNNTFTKIVEVVDLTGKVVSTSTSKLEVVKVNVKDLSNGVYYVKVQSNNSVKVLKIVKQ